MISAQTRRTVRALYAFACGYCGITETEMGAQLTIDHFVPQSAGGTDDIDNLVYACSPCNAFKSATGNGHEPSVLHPLQADMPQHIRLREDDVLQGITPDGTRHIEVLHLNRPPLIARRKFRRLVEAEFDYQANRALRNMQAETEIKNMKRDAKYKMFRKKRSGK